MIWIIITILNAWRLLYRAVRGAVGVLKPTTPCSSSLPPLIPPFFPVKIFAVPCAQPFYTARSYDHTVKWEGKREREGEKKKEKSLKAKKVIQKHNSDSIGRLGQKTFRGCGRKACATEDAYAKVLNLFGSSELLPGRKNSCFLSLKNYFVSKPVQFAVNYTCPVWQM